MLVAAMVTGFAAKVQSSEKSAQVLDRKSPEVIASQVRDFLRRHIQHAGGSGAQQFLVFDRSIDCIGEFQLGLPLRCRDRILCLK